jgi:hypothetical protein
MKVIKPIVINDAVLVSSNVPETEQAPYAAGTNYAVGNRCIYNHVVYETVQTPNTGHQPDISPLYWAVIGPTNKWSMFDSEISTITAVSSPLTVVIKPGYVNSLALFGLAGSTLSITVQDGFGGPVVYSATKTLDGTVIADYYQYFFEPSVQLAEVVFTDLPPYVNAHITVTISGVGSVGCGILLVGTMYMLGDTQLGASAGIIDYSRKDTSASGVTTFVKRKYSKRMSAQLWLSNGQLNKVQRVLADLRATPCAWIGTDVAGYEPLTVFGFYRDFSLDVAYATVSYCHLEIEGLS